MLRPFSNCFFALVFFYGNRNVFPSRNYLVSMLLLILSCRLRVSSPAQRSSHTGSTWILYFSACNGAIRLLPFFLYFLSTIVIEQSDIVVNGTFVDYEQLHKTLFQCFCCLFSFVFMIQINAFNFAVWMCEWVQFIIIEVDSSWFIVIVMIVLFVFRRFSHNLFANVAFLLLLI